MSASTAQQEQKAQPGGSRLWRPPFVGIATTVIMLIGIALAMLLR